MSKRSAEIAFSAEPTRYAPISVTATATTATASSDGSSNNSPNPSTFTTTATANTTDHGPLRARGVRGGRAPFSVPGRAPAYGRHAVYIAPPTTNTTTTTTAGSSGSSQYYSNASTAGATISARPMPASATANNGYYANYYANTTPAASTPAASTATASTSYSSNTAYNYGTTGKETDTTVQGNKNKKARPTLRVGGGEVWEDTTMAEWDENDFRIFVGDLGNEVMDEHLAQAFSKYPSMQKARVVRDKRSGKTRGFGFVSFKDPDDYSRAMREMNGKYLGNRPLKLRKSNWRDRNVDARRKKEKEAKRLGRKV